MTVSGLVSAIVVGLVVGLVGRLVVPGRPAAPIWVTVAVGVGAALSGAIAAVPASAGRLTVPVLLVQAGLAGVGVVLVAATAGDRPRGEQPLPTPRRWRPQGSVWSPTADLPASSDEERHP